MMDKSEIEQLSKDHCLLLAVHHSLEGNVASIETLASLRPDAFNAELVLRILLTYLPESIDPTHYTGLVSRMTKNEQDTTPNASVDVSAVENLSKSKASKRAKKLHLLPLAHSSCPPELCSDPLTMFLIHRAHRIESQTGLVTLFPPLVQPFLETSAFLRTWFISNALPLLRLGYEYYPNGSNDYTLDGLESARGERGVDMLLSKTVQRSAGQDEDGRSMISSRLEEQSNTLSRDLRGLVGPWMFGHNDRKRRRLNGISSRRQSNSTAEEQDPYHGWDHVFNWMIRAATDAFPKVSEAIMDWNGPEDVDLGGYCNVPSLKEDEKSVLLNRYVQAAFASVYAADSNSSDTITNAYKTFVRISNLMKQDPPSPLDSDIEDLQHLALLNPAILDVPKSVLSIDSLLKHNHPLTTPNLETLNFLHLLIRSSYILVELGHPVSVSSAASIRFHHDADEQHGLARRILRMLSDSSRKDESQWLDIRKRMVWLWNWNVMEKENNQDGSGLLGKIRKSTLEKEILEAFLSSSCYSAAVRTYIRDDRPSQLSQGEVEKTIVTSILHYYDNASNGNRTRGTMKKSSDIIAAFRQYYAKSPSFRRCEALLAATHSISFYSLTLQHGVPFQPVSIRVSSDPISLVDKILSQNPRSYIKLDDLISIGTNLVAAGLTDTFPIESPTEVAPSEMDVKKHKAERRIIGMAIEAALNEDDFETAYSYVVNRLNTTSSSARAKSASKDLEDDISWRAALAAGRSRSSGLASYSASSSLSTPPALRRLEQRMELLSQALLLASATALPEILNVWRRCEEEMSSLIAQETEDENDFNDQADRAVPGAFVESSAPVQSRREIGRGAAEEAPMGLFEVARGAAAAFSRSAFPLHNTEVSMIATGNEPPTSTSKPDSDGDNEADRQDRVRRRDIVANAVTGGLASGIGWVLGATPVQSQKQDPH